MSDATNDLYREEKVKDIAIAAPTLGVNPVTIGKIYQTTWLRISFKNILVNNN